MDQIYVPDPLKSETDAWLKGLLVRSEGWVGNFSRHCDDPSTFKIEIEFFESDDFDAYAAVEGGVDVIRISLGLVFILRDLFDRILSHPDTLTFLGGTALENDRTNYPADQKSIDLAAAMQRGRIYKPKDASRVALADYLFSCAFDFVLSHELFHLFFGHVDYLKLKTGFHVLSELNPIISGLTNLDRHTLERDADRNAVFNTMARVVGDYRGQYGSSITMHSRRRFSASVLLLMPLPFLPSAR